MSKRGSQGVTRYPDSCDRCKADGGYWVQQIAVKDIGFGTQEYHYSGRCNCARGQALALKDQESQHIGYCCV